MLVNRIGVGRMADVWQAHRAEGTLPREVTLKLREYGVYQFRLFANKQPLATAALPIILVGD